MKAVMNFDGATLPTNPGPSAGGAVLVIDGSMEPQLVYSPRFHGTNNEAEYNGLIHGLKAALGRGVKHIVIRGDSKLVVEQVSGRWKAKAEHLRPLIAEAQYLLSKFDSWDLQWIPREQNAMADRAADQALRIGNRR